MKTRKDRDGYERVNLSDKKTYFVHRLVAQAFVSGMSFERCVVDHIDNDKENNHWYNLQWMSNEMNVKKMLLNELWAK